MRKNNSQAFEVECYLEQENQMLDKLKRREKEKKEEMFYVKLNEFEIEKKNPPPQQKTTKLKAGGFGFNFFDFNTIMNIFTIFSYINNVIFN